MHPVLFSVGPFTVHTYGALIALAFLVGLILAAKEAKRKGIDPERMMDLGLYILIAAIVGSRLFQVAVEYKYFFQNPLEIVKIWKGGLAFYGGFIGAVFMGIWYLRKHEPARLEGRRRPCAVHRTRTGDRTPWMPFGGLLLRPSDRPPLGHHVQRARDARAARHPPATHPVIRVVQHVPAVRRAVGVAQEDKGRRPAFLDLRDVVQRNPVHYRVLPGRHGARLHPDGELRPLQFSGGRHLRVHDRGGRPDGA